MSLAFTSRLARRAALGVRRLKRSIRGTAAIEFAYLAPLLLLMLLGTIEVARAVSIDRRFGLVTSMVSDLVSREKTLGSSSTATISTLQGMMNSAVSVMWPYATTNLTFKVRNVMALKTDTTKGTVKWSYSCTTTTCTAVAADVCQAYTLASGIVTQNSSVIVVDSTYSYARLFASWAGNMMKNSTWSDKSVHSPRQSCVDDSTGCSAPAACPTG